MLQKNNIEWPANNGLESVSNCPVCSVASSCSKVLHEELTDRVFFCAPGKWTMYRCKSCDSAYLDPRPTPESIILAYKYYFTHKETPNFSTLGFFEKLRRKIANGYRNYHYGTQDYPASIIGFLAANLMPKGSAIIDAGMRHLPKAKRGGRLLDIGCGNGAFLLRARSAGWDVVGVDFDSKAIETARHQSLDVRLGGVEALKPSDGQFDVITLAHVIEHVHRPLEVLQVTHRLLKAGGFLWIETPNIMSEGYRLFGADWVHLDPPRHLVLFTLESMCNALSTAGFAEIKSQPSRPLCSISFRASKAISEGIDPYSKSCQKVPSKIVKKAEQIAKNDPVHQEFITVKAWKS